MAYVETLAGMQVNLDLNADGTLKAGNVEKRYTAHMDGEPRPDSVVRDVLTPETFAALIPSQAALLLRVAALQQECSEKAARISELEAVQAVQTSATDANGVPHTVSDLQARRALLAAGMLPAVEAAVSAAGGDTLLYWERSLVVRRDSPFIATMGTVLGLSAETIDGLFIAAASL
jgi:hypothetical protein